MTWKTKAYLTWIGLVVGGLVYLWRLPLGTFTEGEAEGADLIGRVFLRLLLCCKFMEYSAATFAGSAKNYGQLK